MKLERPEDYRHAALLLSDHLAALLLEPGFNVSARELHSYLRIGRPFGLWAYHEILKPFTPLDDYLRVSDGQTDYHMTAKTAANIALRGPDSLLSMPMRELFVRGAEAWIECAECSHLKPIAQELVMFTRLRRENELPWILCRSEDSPLTPLGQ